MFVKLTSLKEGKMFEISGGKLVASVVSTASAEVRLFRTGDKSSGSTFAEYTVIDDETLSMG